MSYNEALEAAGAKVLAFEHFGSYQGDWLAKVEHDGKVGWIHGYYGSCSGCDAFEAEFGWNDESQPNYKDRLAKFGKEYLDTIVTQDEIVAEVSKNLEWDHDAEEMLTFVRNNPTP